MRATIIAMLVLVSACGAFGPGELRDSERAEISADVGRWLKNSESARYIWPPISEKNLGKEGKSGIEYCGWVNAKNSFGAYEGYAPFYARIWRDTRGGYLPQEGDRLSMTQLFHERVMKLCRDAGYDVDLPPKAP